MEDTPLVARPPGYHSYLLRFWEERSEQAPLTVWRFSLEDPLTDQRYGFPSLNALVEWVQTRIDNQVENHPE
ncbi:MAG: hypothetical protein WCF84_06735 [Anaerolineae bacterium]